MMRENPRAALAEQLTEACRINVLVVACIMACVLQ
jgi:hypothetical protein